MSFLLQPFKWIAKIIVQKALVNKQDEIVQYINDRINIPKLDEDEEAVVYDHIYTALLSILQKFL